MKPAESPDDRNDHLFIPLSALRIDARELPPPPSLAFHGISEDAVLRRDKGAGGGLRAPHCRPRRIASTDGDGLTDLPDLPACGDAV
jgi:hypothetical protein